jgi:hypothetical protein
MIKKTLRRAAAAWVLVAAIGAQTPLAAQTAKHPEPEWSAVAERLPIGSLVKVRTRSGEKLTAVLFETDATGITVKPLKRIPEPSRRIAFGEIDRLERDHDRIRWGRAAAIGAAVGGAVFLALLGIAGSE